MSKESNLSLETFRVPVNIKLSLLWASLMFLYIYNDYFSLYLPGTIEHMAAGRMGPTDRVSELELVAYSLLLAIPALMIFLSAALPPIASRWLNVLLAAVYTVVEILTLFVFSAPFYRTVVVLEILLTLLIFWYALRWPRKGVSNTGGEP